MTILQIAKQEDFVQEGYWSVGLIEFIYITPLLHEKSAKRPPIHWYKESFRKPPVFRRDDHGQWCDLLLDFEPRLKQSGGTVKNITAKGYTSENNRLYPAGHSSGSYVFDLKNACFKELFYVIK